MFGKLFKKEKEEKVEEIISTNIDNHGVDIKDIKNQIDWLISNGWADKFDPNKKTLLIMDDREAIISSIMDDLQSLDFDSQDFILDNYNIITFHSKMAGFSVIEMLEIAPLIEIDYALLDIILGGKKIIDGKRTMVDGVDVCLKIWNSFPNTEILFFSGCIIEDNNKDIFNFKEKFEDYTNDSIENYLLPKDSNFEDELEKLAEFFLGFTNKK